MKRESILRGRRRKCLWSFLSCLHLEAFRCLNVGGHHALKYLEALWMHFTTLYDTLYFVLWITFVGPDPHPHGRNKIHLDVSVLRCTQMHRSKLRLDLSDICSFREFKSSSLWGLVGGELTESWPCWCRFKEELEYLCSLVKNVSHLHKTRIWAARWAGSVSERYQAWVCISLGCISGPLNGYHTRQRPNPPAFGSIFSRCVLTMWWWAG